MKIRVENGIETWLASCLFPASVSFFRSVVQLSSSLVTIESAVSFRRSPEISRIYRLFCTNFSKLDTQKDPLSFLRFDLPDYVEFGKKTSRFFNSRTLGILISSGGESNSEFSINSFKLSYLSCESPSALSTSWPSSSWPSAFWPASPFPSPIEGRQSSSSRISSPWSRLQWIRRVHDRLKQQNVKMLFRKLDGLKSYGKSSLQN